MTQIKPITSEGLNQRLIGTQSIDHAIDEDVGTSSFSYEIFINHFRFPSVTSPALTARSLHPNTFEPANIDGDPLDKPHKSPKLMGMWSAGFTIVNIYLGLALLSYPYAIYQGGLISFVLLAFVCVFMSWTGKLLVRCFVKMHPSKRTYPDVGHRSYGALGVFLVCVGVMLEFFGAININLLFLWDNVQYLIDSLKFDDVQIGILPFITSAVILPTCWLLNISDLSFISALGCMSKLLTVFATLLCFFLNLDAVRDNLTQGKIAIYPKDLESLSIAVGIFIMSLGGAPVLPSVYNSMKNPERFEVLLDRCFMGLFVIYCMMALAGYLQFGEDTQVVITSNLIQFNADGNGSRFQLIICQIVLVFIVLGLYFAMSPLLAVFAEIPEMNMLKIKSKFKQRLFRTVLFGVCVGTAYVMMNDLAVLEAITGSMCTVITTVIAPTLFYYALYTDTLTKCLRVSLILSAFLGTLFGLCLLFNDVKALIG
eukprot:349498_1